MISSALLLTVLLLYGRRRKESYSSAANGKTAPTEDQKKTFRHCPLCGSPLQRHERVKSVLYPGQPDGFMEIYGCPYCYRPGGDTAGSSPVDIAPRYCPVCKKRLEPADLIFARFFQGQNRRHVHVLGCSQCYRRGRSQT
ncbi:MAG TPA: hypothetical protein ENN41_08200 [Sediminispirochaeta sp.]|nr:hypothetical protein [Sediminispirochaeta sp.]